MQHEDLIQKSKITLTFQFLFFISFALSTNLYHFPAAYVTSQCIECMHASIPFNVKIQKIYR